MRAGLVAWPQRHRPSPCDRCGSAAPAVYGRATTSRSSTQWSCEQTRTLPACRTQHSTPSRLEGPHMAQLDIQRCLPNPVFADSVASCNAVSDLENLLGRAPSEAHSDADSANIWSVWRSLERGITGSAIGMLGKVWSSGALAVVQNVAIIPGSVHPRDKLEGVPLRHDPPQASHTRLIAWRCCHHGPRQRPGCLNCSTAGGGTEASADCA